MIGAVVLGLAGLLGVGWLAWTKGLVGGTVLVEPWAVGELPGSRQDWLVSPTGGPVPLAEVRAYLDHDDLIPERLLTVTLVAPLAELLAEGEAMPDPVYHAVMADIRAPVLAERLCVVLMESLAERCAVASARVRSGSLDPVQGTAHFRLEILFAESVEGQELPDLARHVLDTEVVSLAPDTGRGGTVEAALRALVASAKAACQGSEDRQACRVLRLTLDLKPGRTATGQTVIGALVPLPVVLRPASELVPAPEN